MRSAPRRPARRSPRRISVKPATNQIRTPWWTPDDFAHFQAAAARLVAQTKIREPALKRRVVTNGHAPPEYRADTVRNLDAWYGTFNVQPGQKLYLAPQDRARIW